jgi:hypothetical protein
VGAVVVVVVVVVAAVVIAAASTATISDRHLRGLSGNRSSR